MDIENNNPTVVEENSPEDFNLHDLLVQCIAQWRWYVLTVVVGLLVAFYIVKKTEPTYQRDAAIVVLDESQGQSMNSKLADFSDMGIFKDNTNVNNVMATIQSPDIMSEVVKRLHLDVDYTHPGTFYNGTLYGNNLPVKVDFMSVAKDKDAALKLTLHKDNTVELSDFVYNGEEKEGEPLRAKLGQVVNTPVGRVLVSPTPFYSGIVEEGDKINVSKSDNYSATQRFLGGLTVTLTDKNATVLDLNYKDVSTQRAEDILNMVITVYNDVWIENKNRISISTSHFIDQRLAVIEKELGNVDTDISNYKSKNLIPDVNAASNLFMNRSDQNNTTLLDLNSKLSVAQYIRDFLVDKSHTNQLIPVNLGIDNDKIEDQINNFNSIQLERNTMVTNSGRNNPLVQDMDNSLASIRKSIIYSIDNYMLSTNTKIKHLQGFEEKTNTKISANPTQAKFLLSVERQQKVKEALYLFLLQKREETQLSQAFTAYNTQVIKTPTGSNSPLSPKKNIILLIGLVMGLVIPTALIYLREANITTVRGRKDVEGKISAPFLGEIPEMEEKKYTLPFLPKKHKAHLGIVVEPSNHNVINEAFRVLRTNLEFMLGTDNHTDVTLFTSFNVGSGKTFLSINIAASLAIKGKRVLIIDGDMRKATLSHLLHHAHHGLSNYLGNQIDDVDQIIKPYDKCKGLDIIPVGTIPPNPTELLYSERLGQLFEEMRRRYDYVFVDCPPIDVVADTSIIAKEVDRSIFVVRAGLLERGMISEVDKIYKSGRLKNMTVMLNGTEYSTSGYGYRYGYSYGYGYGRYTKEYK